MNKLVFGLVLAIGGTTSVLCITAARHEDTIRPNTKVGPVDVGGMTPEEASRTLRIWWEGEKLNKLTLKMPNGKTKLPPMKPGELGLTLDDVASVKSLPLQSFLGDAKAVVTKSDFTPEQHAPIFKSTGESLDAVAKVVRQSVGPNRPASVHWVKGAVVRHPEVAGVALDTNALPARVAAAVMGDHTVEIPLTEGAKHIPDAELSKIKEVVSEFSTRFSARNRPRSSNIRLAASKIDGVVLMPGETFSFNSVVGRRTLRAGFKLAGVYKNGQHDTGIGGGICQVSTTLFNSALFANLAIQRRSNHSLPVPYVPLGRDATVDYGNLDLEFKNTYQSPIALSALYVPGRLTFRVLGTKQPGVSVKVIQTGHRSWAAGTERVFDSSLPSGRTRVVKPGSTGHSVTTYRCVYENGKLVRRERIGFSRYGGDPTIIAVGTGAAPIPSQKPATIAPPTTPAPGNDQAPTTPESEPIDAGFGMS
ncbi:VanW family protein [Fimbriimonas ginsengisoli]|uniref:VanW family protein n=1 Tax=Fimbriimonas ginsengisoli Gsoil 348 TaxID=661478 RepID=A0A068NTB7_FIMGI|nr:VanW family protein [Fimbriimonas ginsengisoli]AIE86798.1 VanW family protein [Fimbriimonas ginsengisoli Gsoil 348]